MNHNPYCLADDELLALLRDDCPYGDATTSGLAIGGQPGRLGFAARQAMVVCGSEEAQRLGELNGWPISDEPTALPSTTTIEPFAASRNASCATPVIASG